MFAVGGVGFGRNIFRSVFFQRSGYRTSISYSKVSGGNSEWTEVATQVSVPEEAKRAREDNLFVFATSSELPTIELIYGKLQKP